MKQPTAVTTVGWGETSPRVEGGTVFADLLLRIVDCGLIGVICIAPFFFGGRHDLGRLVLVSLISLIAAAWFARQAILPTARWPRTTAYVLLLLAAAWLGLQLLPLPPAWIAYCSPRAAQLLPLWTPGGNEAVTLGAWQTLSFVPHETTKSLAMLLSYGLLFMVVAGRIQSAADVQRLLSWIVVAAVLMAAFGLLQYFTSDGRYFWFYTHPHRSAAQSINGAFINRNHFAHFLVLGLGPIVAWRMQFAARARSVALSPRLKITAAQRLVAWSSVAALVLVVVAILGSQSRGGAIAMLAAAVVLIAIYVYRGLIDSRFLYGFIGLVVVVVGVLSLYGYDEVVRRLDDFAEGSLDGVDHGGIRRKIWSANLAAIDAFRFTGAGVGSHREICPVYMPESFTKEYTHANNGYLQVATEAGILGIALLVGGVGLIAAWAATGLRRAAQAADIHMLGAAVAGLAASLVHSVVEFVWYVPACMSVTIVLAGCVLRLSQLARKSVDDSIGMRTLPRGRWLELTAASILVSAWTVQTYFGPAVAAIHWERYLRASVADSRLSQETMARFVAGDGIAPQEDRRSLSRAMLRHLQSAIDWDPKFARAHGRLADRYMAEFEYRVSDAANVLDVTQIRDAAMDSEFRSVEELHAWLDRAFGPDVELLRQALAHAHRALELCPLQGDAYLHLADLSFLEMAPRPAVQAYIDQGLRVRPYDRNVLTTAGRQALLQGRVDDALEHWSRCFNTPGRHQQEIVYRLVASGMPANEFIAWFRPDWHTLRQIWTQYRKLGGPQDWNDILSYAAAEAERESSIAGGISPVFVWFGQSKLYADLGQHEESLACLERAYACDPRQYFVRHSLAKALQAAERFAEAEPHIRWCLARRPADKSLRAALVAISKARLAQRESIQSSKQRWNPNGVPAKVSSSPAPTQR